MSYFYVFISHIFSLIITLLLAENNIKTKLDNNLHIYKKKKINKFIKEVSQ